nr:SAHS [Paramacrobiotus areolatus]
MHEIYLCQRDVLYFCNLMQRRLRKLFCNVTGFPHYAGDNKAFHKFWKDGDHFHHGIAIPDKNFKKIVEFKFGEEQTINVNGTDYKVRPLQTF